MDKKTKDTRLDWDELCTTTSEIIEIFEDFLDSKGIIIDNPEKEQSPDSASNIYGTDYGMIQCQLESLFMDKELVTQEILDKFK